MSDSTHSVCLSPLPGRAVLAVGGPDGPSFLDGLLTNGWGGNDSQAPLYAGLLTPQGKLLYDMILVQGSDELLLDVARDHLAALTQRLALYKLRAKVTLDPRPDWEVTAVWGPGIWDPGTHAGLALAPATSKPHGAGVLYADPRSPALGARLMHPKGATLPAFASRPPEAYRAMRLAFGIGEGPEIGDERCYPLEANFEPLHGVDFKKGCYVGQELTARMKHRRGVRKRVLPVHADAALSEGATVRADDRDLGTLLAAEGSRGLALLRIDRLQEAGGAPLVAESVPVRLDWPSFLPPLEQLT